MIKRLVTTAGVLALLGGCGEGQDASTAMAQNMPQSSVARTVDFAQVARGGSLYKQYCAECHGVKGEGAPNWRQRDSDGLFPAPPLNGSGHAWHHPKAMLQYVIANGSPGGQGRMPAWKDKLSTEEINDIIAWFMSRWPDQAYQAWHRMNERAKKGG